MGFRAREEATTPSHYQYLYIIYMALLSLVQMTKTEGFIDKAWKIQNTIENKGKHFGKGKYGRIFKIAKKPSEEEYTKTIEISILGLLVLGLIGFGIYLLFYWIWTFY